MRVPVFLGVDGGGTATKAVLVSESGEVLGCGEAGPSNFLGVGVDAACVAIRAAVQATGATLPVEAAFLGLAGVGREPGWSQMRAAIAEMGLAHRFDLATDAEVALAGAHAGEPGAIAAAGTGAIALAKATDGTVHRVDGWGHLLGDEGSGYWIGREALRTAFRSADGRLAQPTALPERLREHFQVASMADLVSLVYSTPPPVADIAALTPLVADCAESGDETARMLLFLAARHLAGSAGAVLRAAGLPEGPLSYTGGVFRIAPVLDWFVGFVPRRDLCNVSIRPPLMTAAEGAALLARRL